MTIILALLLVALFLFAALTGAWINRPPEEKR